MSTQIPAQKILITSARRQLDPTWQFVGNRLVHGKQTGWKSSLFSCLWCQTRKKAKLQHPKPVPRLYAFSLAPQSTFLKYKQFYLKNLKLSNQEQKHSR